MTIQLRNVRAPFFLRDLPIWLVWKLEPNKDPSKKPLKVPYYANGRRRNHKHGSPEDRELLTDFESAKRFAIENNFTGLGTAILPDNDITGVDFDKVVVDGELLPEVEEMAAGTYAEYSPSGTGIHLFVEGTVANLSNDKDTATDDTYGIELFTSKGFLTFTGNTLPVCELRGEEDTLGKPNEKLLTAVAGRFTSNGPAENVPSEVQTPVSNLDTTQIAYLLDNVNPDCGYSKWLHVGMALHHESNGQNFEAWDLWSSKGQKYDSTEYNLTKWHSFDAANATSRPITIKTLIKYANEEGANFALTRLTDTDFDVIAEESSIPNTTDTHFRIKSAADFMANVTPISWLIKGFLPKATLGVLYGESGSGKSFVALDICASIGRQVDWNGLRCQGASGRILYVIAEGVGGFSNRFRSYCHQKGISPADLPIEVISEVTPNLMDGLSVAQLIKDISSREPYDLIVMDTFAQVMPTADENSGQDMGLALAYCQKISKASKAMVLLVHHSGKDATKGARGHSKLKAAADVMFEITRFENDRCLKVYKQKDGEDGKEFGFNLLPVVLGEDEDGDDITSCVVEYCEFIKPIKKVGLKSTQKAIYDVLFDFNPDSWVTKNHVVELCLECIPKDDDAKDNRKSNIKRAISSMTGEWIIENETGEIMLKR